MVLGAACLVAGFVIAVAEDQAAPLLIVGVALLVLAIVGDQWETMRANIAGNEVEISRRAADLGAAGERLEEIAEGQPEDVQLEIRKVAASISEAATELAPVELLGMSAGGDADRVRVLLHLKVRTSVGYLRTLLQLPNGEQVKLGDVPCPAAGDATVSVSTAVDPMPSGFFSVRAYWGTYDGKIVHLGQQDFTLA